MNKSDKTFPLIAWKGKVPIDTKHPGSFAAIRRHDIHTGVDLYVYTPEPVLAIEDGIIVAIEEYTGPLAGSPWWLPTQAVLIEGESGVFCYGEIKVDKLLKIGENVSTGTYLGNVMPVLPEEKLRTDIVHHSNMMLHMELYNHGTTESVIWDLNTEKPQNLLNPTNILKELLK